MNLRAEVCVESATIFHENPIAINLAVEATSDMSEDVKISSRNTSLKLTLTERQEKVE